MTKLMEASCTSPPVHFLFFVLAPVYDFLSTCFLLCPVAALGESGSRDGVSLLRFLLFDIAKYFICGDQHYMSEGQSFVLKIGYFKLK